MPSQPSFSVPTQAHLSHDSRRASIQYGASTWHLSCQDDHVFRVTLVHSGGPSQRHTWSVVDGNKTGAAIAPWEGCPRLDMSDADVQGASNVALDSGNLTLETPAARLKVQLSPFKLSWCTSEGVLFAEDRPSMPYRLSKSGAFTHAMRRWRGESFFGLGDKTGPLDLHGRRLRTLMTDALGYDPATGDPLYKHWPFFIVRHSLDSPDAAADGAALYYGIFYDNAAAATFDFGCEHSNYYGLYRTYEAEAGDLDFHVIVGPRLRDVVGRFVRLTGAPPLPPRWTLGYHCTAMPLADAADAQAQIAAFVDLCATHAIPCSAFHFGSGYTSVGPRRYVFNWNRSKFPDPEALMAKLHAAGMRVVANLKPCLLDDHPRFAEACAQGLFIKDRESGAPSISQFWDGHGAHLDFTNPATVQWWQAGLREAVLGVGMDCAWNDNNEYEIWDEDAVCCDFGRTPALPLALAKPLHSLLMTRASYEEQLRTKPQERPYTVTRAGMPGIQRYAQTWSGDNTTSWATLKWNLRTGLCMSLSGMFNIGHDVGGFAGPVPEAELFVRWVQTGVLHPRFIMNSWKSCGTVTAPWLHAPVLAAVRWAIRLRYRLLPTLYTLLWRAAREREPVVRPTFFDFEGDARCLADCDDLLLGPALLAAPVVERGARSRQLYFPKDSSPGGGSWYDLYSGEVQAGGSSALVAAPLERLPLFAAAASMLLLTAEARDFAATHDETSRCLLVLPPPTGEQLAVGGAPADAAPAAGVSFASEFYEDDGISFGYQAGACVVLRFEAEATASEVHVRVTRAATGGASAEKGESFSLPFDTVTVALPPSDSRRLVLENPANAEGLPRLVAGELVWHGL